MKQYIYRCRLLSDVVITSRAATQGFNESLDYIPGAKFLGLVAGQCYDTKHPQQTLDLFHNGKVRFGDAHPVIGGEASLRIPFTWMQKKKAPITAPIYLQHLLTDDKQSSQLVPMKVGFVSPSWKYVKVDQNFSIRSAYNREQRRAMDTQMFGYFSLPAGSEWEFVIEDDTESYGKLLRDTLKDICQIGRSKSAEYGQIKIEFRGEREPSAKQLGTEKLHLIYAASNLCFYNQYGQTTATPTPADLKLPDGSVIHWDKSQIRSRLYQVWNQHRKNRDADRIVVQKGSVFAVELSASITESQYASGIGYHRSEGFGRVLINPVLLHSDSEQLPHRLDKVKLSLHQESKPEKLSPADSIVLHYLNRQDELTSYEYDLEGKVNDFIKGHPTTFTDITSSQWGTIGNYARNSDAYPHLHYLLFNKDMGALYKGQAEPYWRERKRRDILEQYIEKEISDSERVFFVLKLSTEMAKSSN